MNTLKYVQPHGLLSKYKLKPTLELKLKNKI